MGKENNVKTRRKIAIVLLVVCLLAVFSAIYVCTKSHHCCDEEDCPICALLRIAEVAGKILLLVVVLPLFLWGITTVVRTFVRNNGSTIRNTLISLKTKLSA